MDKKGGFWGQNPPFLFNMSPRPIIMKIDIELLKLWVMISSSL